MKKYCLKYANAYLTNVSHEVQLNNQKEDSWIEFVNYGVNDTFQFSVEKEEIQIGKYGKPYVKWNKEHSNNKQIYFNLSHSYELEVCAVSEFEIGCDIQKVRKIPRNLYPYLNTFYYALTGKENVKDLKLKDQIQLWTKYESFGKCLGIGIPIPGHFYKRQLLRDKYNFIQINDMELYSISICHSY